MISRARCFLFGHPDWRETTINARPGALTHRYAVGRRVAAEIEAYQNGLRAFRCVRCVTGLVAETYPQPTARIRGSHP